MIRVLLASAFLLVTAAHAQQPAASCKLLQVAELESALGGKASKPPSGASQGGVDTCEVVISMPRKGEVRVARMYIIKDLPMDGGEALRMRNAGTAREAQWKAAGARLEQKTVGNAICIMSARPGVAGHSVCGIPRGKGYVELDVSASLDDLVPLDTVLALVQKAVTRL